MFGWMRARNSPAAIVPGRSPGKLYVFAGKQGLPIFEQQTASVLAKANENWQGLHKPP